MKIVKELDGRDKKSGIRVVEIKLAHDKDAVAIALFIINDKICVPKIDLDEHCYSCLFYLRSTGRCEIELLCMSPSLINIFRKFYSSNSNSWYRVSFTYLSREDMRIFSLFINRYIIKLARHEKN